MAVMYFFIQQSYHTYKIENGQNDHLGHSSLKYEYCKIIRMQGTVKEMNPSTDQNQ